MRFRPFAAAMMLLTAALAYGQTPAFDAASVKPAVPPARPTVSFLPGGRFEARNSTLLAILQQAYDVSDFQIQDGPPWVATDRFDIEATPASSTEPPQLRLMLQALLADRFRLRIHRETRSLPVYELVPGKNGARLSSVSPGATPVVDSNPSGGYLTATNVGMPRLIAALQRWLDRPLIDKTGVVTSFDARLSWAPGPENTRNAGPVPPAPDDRRPDIFTAVQEQLGLRLNSAHDSMDVIVVEHAEHPSAN